MGKFEKIMFNIDIPNIDIDFDVNIGSDDIDSRYSKPKSYSGIKQKHVKYNNALKMAKETRIGENERIDCLVSGNFIFGDFIEAYFVEHQIHTERLVISTLSMSQNNIDSLKTLMVKGYVDNLDIVVSRYFFGLEKWKLIPYLYQELDFDDRFQLAVAAVHTKVMLAKTSGEKHLVITGRANLRSSMNIETFMIEDNKQSYEFHLDYHDKIMDKYKTINKQKTPKRGDLWGVVKGK